MWQSAHPSTPICPLPTKRKQNNHMCTKMNARECVFVREHPYGTRCLYKLWCIYCVRIFVAFHAFVCQPPAQRPGGYWPGTAKRRIQIQSVFDFVCAIRRAEAMSWGTEPGAERELNRSWTWAEGLEWDLNGRWMGAEWGAEWDLLRKLNSAARERKDGSWMGAERELNGSWMGELGFWWGAVWELYGSWMASWSSEWELFGVSRWGHI